MTIALKKAVEMMKNDMKIVVAHATAGNGRKRVLCSFSNEENARRWISRSSRVGLKLLSRFSRITYSKELENGRMTMRSIASDVVKYLCLALCVNDNKCNVDQILFIRLETIFKAKDRHKEYVYRDLFVDFLPLLRRLASDCDYEISEVYPEIDAHSSLFRGRVRREECGINGMKKFLQRLRKLIERIDDTKRILVHEKTENNASTIDLSSLSKDVVFFAFFSFFDVVSLLRMTILSKEFKDKIWNHSLRDRMSTSERDFFFAFHPPVLIGDDCLSRMIEFRILAPEYVMHYTYPFLFKSEYPKTRFWMASNHVLDFPISIISTSDEERHHREVVHFVGSITIRELLQDVSKFTTFLSYRWERGRFMHRDEHRKNEIIPYLEYIHAVDPDYIVKHDIIEILIKIMGGDCYVSRFPEGLNHLHDFYDRFISSSNDGFLSLLVCCSSDILTTFRTFENVEAAVCDLIRRNAKYQDKEFMRKFLVEEKHIKRGHSFLLKTIIEKTNLDSSFDDNILLKKAEWLGNDDLILYLLTIPGSDPGYNILSKELADYISMLLKHPLAKNHFFDFNRSENIFLSYYVVPRIVTLLQKAKVGETEMSDIFLKSLLREDFNLVKVLLEHPYSHERISRKYRSKRYIMKIMKKKYLESGKWEIKLVSVCQKLGICTFWATGEDMVEQKGYVCEECPGKTDPTNRICSVCIKKCHIGHETIQDSDRGEMFCDCFTGDWGIQCICRSDEL